MVSMSISKRGERQRYLPLEIRLQMYDDVIKLRKQGLIYKEIQRRIYENYGMILPLSTLSTWINKKNHPLGKINKFDRKPSREFAYIIGTIFGDGYIYFDGRRYQIVLAVKDKEFAEEFGKCLTKVLGRKEPYKPFWSENRKLWVIEVCSILLYKFLNRPLEELKPYIEYSKETVASFLKALFDGEGSIYKRVLMLYNTNIELLNYAKYLLKKFFDIDTTGPNLATKGGELRHFPNRKTTKTTKEYYYLYIRVKSLLSFYKNVEFTIKRKQRRLIEAIQK
ncbi:MAG: LAGLIDADG family homing endonuclease [Nitrososphaerota archaeon]